MATLAGLLALLPDNTFGSITAHDLRTVITELWEKIDEDTPTEVLVLGIADPVPPGTEPGTLIARI